MTIEEIKELLQVFNESGVGELELQRGGDVLRIRRSGEAGTAPTVTSHARPAAEVPAAAVSAAPAAAPKTPEPDSNHVLVPSPIVGTFYEASAPGAPPFVKVGDSVEVGQVLCIIESMKLMNEIEAEVSGIIVAKFVESGKPVEYGQKLFAIQPR